MEWSRQSAGKEWQDLGRMLILRSRGGVLWGFQVYSDWSFLTKTAGFWKDTWYLLSEVHKGKALTGRRDFIKRATGEAVSGTYILLVTLQGVIWGMCFHQGLMSV